MAVSVPRTKSAWNVVAIEPEDFDAARVVASMPLAIDGAVFAEALAEGGWVFLAGEGRDDAHGTELGFVTFICEPDGASAGREDDGLFVGGDVHGAAEGVLPIDTAVLVGEPGGAVPAIAFELHDFTDEVPFPADGAVGLEGVYLGPKGSEVDAITVDDGGTEDRFATGYLTDDGAVTDIQDDVRSGRGAEVEEAVDEGRGGDVVAVDGAAGCWCLPDDVARLGIDTEGDAGCVDDVDAAIDPGGGSEDGVGEGDGGDESEWGRDLSIGDVP